jgi:hypothetical protein
MIAECSFQILILFIIQILISFIIQILIFIHYSNTYFYLLFNLLLILIYYSNTYEAVAHQGHRAAVHHRVAGRLAVLERNERLGCKPPGRGRWSGGRELHDEAAAHQGHRAAVHHRVAGRLAGLHRDERLGSKPPRAVAVVEA